MPLHPTHFEAAVQRMSKFQSVLFLYTFLSSISFFPLRFRWKPMSDDTSEVL